jgi:phage terminase large subunit
MKQLVNEKYKPLFETTDRYIILMGGRGAGRSTVASQYLLAKLVAPEFFRCAIMRAVHSDIRSSSWRELGDRIDEQNIRSNLQIADNSMTIKYGANTIQAHGFKASSGSHSAKLKSLANYNHVWIEEAEEIGEQEFMTLDDTLRTVKGNIKIILTLNPPPKNHWIIRRFFDLEPSGVQGFYTPTAKEGTYIRTSYKDNIANLDENTIRRYEDYENTKPAYYHQMIQGLVPDVVRGKIYSDWRLIDEVPHNARLLRYGLDFGWFPDPAALVAIYYYDGGYIIDELAYGTHLSNKQLAEVILSHPHALTVADSAEPKSIAEMQSYGVTIIGTDKSADSVNYGIKVVSGVRISVTRRSPNVWESYENFAWAETKDGEPKNEPARTWKHAMDAIAYPLVNILGTIDPEASMRQELRREVNKHTRLTSRAKGYGL